MVVGIIGLGLIGGSFALSLRENIKEEIMIVGYDNNPLHAKEALDLKIIDSSLSKDELKKIADLIILAIPVSAIKDELKNMQNIKKNCTIIDFGSTKESIVQSVPNEIREHFVAAHPMAGTEYSGPKAAFGSLLKGKVVVLCDIEDSGEAQAELAKKIFNTIGMKIVYMSSKEHDRHAAFISHTPHIISYALANSVISQEDKKSILTLAAGGFRDMSRLAKSSPSMWRDIVIENKETVLKSIDIFEKELLKAKELIKSESWEELHEWMKNASSLHQLFD
ncbi:MAG: prephenate dehydrogenase [Campylobacterota bacterium]|nr:prephenate dehydrogenase [Campylobacterota bacterium]